MGLFTRMAAPMIRASAGVPTYGMIPPLGSVQSASSLLVSQATAMTVSAVYACVSRVAQDVARCTASLQRAKEDGSRARVTDHPVAKLLVRPNRIQTWFEFARDLTVAVKLRGNGYAAILRDHRGDPTELILINPDAVMMLEAADGSIFYNVNRLGLFQIAMLQQFPVAIPAEDVFHVRGISFNMLIGVSTIGLARDTIGLAMAQSQQQSRWVGNGARPSVILQSPRSLTADAAARLKTQWEQFSSGIQNVGRTAVLEDGIEAKPLQLSSVDLQFIEQMKLTVDDVCRFMDVPPRKIGVPDAGRAGSAVIQQDQAYVNDSIMPMLTMIEQKFGVTFDLDREGLELDLDEDELLRADPMTRFNIGRIGKLSGLTSTNEFRRKERLPPVPGGEEIMQPLNMAVLGSDMSGNAADGAGRPKDSEAAAPISNAQPEPDNL